MVIHRLRERMSVLVQFYPTRPVRLCKYYISIFTLFARRLRFMISFYFTNYPLCYYITIVSTMLLQLTRIL